MTTITLEVQRRGIGDHGPRSIAEGVGGWKMEHVELIARTISISLPFGILMGMLIGYSLFGGSGSSGQKTEDR
jgi:hypothetical protein